MANSLPVTNVSKREKIVVAYFIGLLQTDAYFDAYYLILADIPSGKDAPVKAFNQLENHLQTVCGCGRYSDYNSFREMRRRYARRLAKRRRKRST